MTHPRAFGFHVRPILGALAHDDWHSIGDIDAVVEELVPLVGVVGDQLDGGDAHRVQHLCGEIVLSGVSGQAQGKVGVEGVKAGVLKRICCLLYTSDAADD